MRKAIVIVLIFISLAGKIDGNNDYIKAEAELKRRAESEQLIVINAEKKVAYEISYNNYTFEI